MSEVKRHAQILPGKSGNLCWEVRKNIREVDVVASHRKHLRFSFVGNKSTSLSEDIKDGRYRRKLLLNGVDEYSGIVSIERDPTLYRA
jgi:hypothetical protein